MNKKDECKIVQDLLPNYAENLTNAETNYFIEEHLEECDNCQKILENMKKNITVENKNKESDEVNYIKKYNTRLKKMKYTSLIIVWTLIAIILIFIGRKLIIFNMLSNKLSEYPNSTNYHIIIYEYWGWYSNTTEIQSQDGKYTSTHDGVLQYKLNNDTIYYYNLSDGTLEEIKENAKDEEINSILAYPWNVTEALADKLKNPINAFKYSLSEATVNGKDCYKITMYDGDTDIVYLQKDNGLVVRHEMLSGEKSRISEDKTQIQSTLIDYRIEFDCVTDDNFKEYN